MHLDVLLEIWMRKPYLKPLLDKRVILPAVTAQTQSAPFVPPPLLPGG
jgi:hypothetical protein